MPTHSGYNFSYKFSHCLGCKDKDLHDLSRLAAAAAAAAVAPQGGEVTTAKRMMV
jgi:hypothetical protein